MGTGDWGLGTKKGGMPKHPRPFWYYLKPGVSEA